MNNKDIKCGVDLLKNDLDLDIPFLLCRYIVGNGLSKSDVFVSVEILKNVLKEVLGDNQCCIELNNITENTIPEVRKLCNLVNIRILQNGGIIGDPRILNFNSLKEYIDFMSLQRKQEHRSRLNKWIDGNKARKYFVDYVPRNKKETVISDKKEVLIETIEKYYDTSFFTISELNKNQILIRERDYGKDRRIGICIKKEPYANQFTITLRDILGDYNVSNEGNGWTLELEKGAKFFSVSKSYSGKELPSKYELINDICIYDLLEQQEPKEYIIKDTGKISVYPTAKEYFKDNN